MKRLIKLISSFLSPYSMADIDPVVAYTIVEEGRGVLIDSREKEELGNGMIEGAHWIPVSALSNKSVIERLKNLREQQIKLFVYGNAHHSAGKLHDILLQNKIEAADLGTFEALEEILPVKFFTESSGMSENQMI